VVGCSLPRPAKSGFQVSLYGLAGILLAGREGLEVNLLGLSLGVDPIRPAATAGAANIWITASCVVAGIRGEASQIAPRLVPRHPGPRVRQAEADQHRDKVLVRAGATRRPTRDRHLSGTVGIVEQNTG